jgi:hypothetical protein
MTTLEQRRLEPGYEDRLRAELAAKQATSLTYAATKDYLAEQAAHADRQYAELFATLTDADLAEALENINEELCHLPYAPLRVDKAARGEWLRDEKARFKAEIERRK